MGLSATKATAVGVVRRLRAAGYEALLAGGCVRDMLMGHRASDYDVATSATPRQVKQIFGHVLMIGAKFGVAMVIINRRTIEVTTFRSDLSYSDGRRPDGVKFVTPKRDAQRRDFTINGMFYDPISRRVIDYVGGKKDLQAGVIRAIGDPERRFAEDYLRMLRAVRFAGRFGFRIERATARAIKRRAGRITKISGERIREELEKMFARKPALATLKQLHKLQLIKAILPELFADTNHWSKASRRAGAVSERGDALLTIASLLCDLPASDIRRIVRRWGGSNEMRKSLLWMSEHLDDWRTAHEMSLAQFKRILAHRDFRRLEMLWRFEERFADGGKSRSLAIRRRIKAIDPKQIDPQPLLTGADLKEIGLKEGAILGRVLRKLYDAQLNEQITNRRDALRMARSLITDR